LRNRKPEAQKTNMLDFGQEELMMSYQINLSVIDDEIQI
jgi:hypothetical protein